MHFSKREEGHYVSLNHFLTSDKLIDYQLKMLNLSDQKAFIKAKYLKENLIYDITSLVPIDLYFKSNCLSFESQKLIFKKMISSVWIAEKYLLNNEKIILDKEYIYVDPTDLSIKLIYLPSIECNNAMTKSFKEVFLSLLFSVKIDCIENDHRLRRVIKYLQDDEFELMVFDSMLTTMKVEKLPQKKYWLKKMFNKARQDDIIEKDTSDHTILLSKEKDYPVLEFKEKEVVINKESFLIGRSKQMVDYAMPEALSLGRVHLELITEDSGYYIVDINTKNGTFLNGKRLKSQKKYQINKGDSIQIANKKAVFK